MALIGAVLVLGLTACGSAADQSASTDGTVAAASPPVIQVDGSQIGDTAGGDEEQIRQMDVVLPARKFTQDVLNVFLRSSYV